MNDNELNEVPATALKTMAAQIEERGGRVFFRGNNDRASLAAAALWQFARLSGLDDDSESLDTVLSDFLGDMLHLCEQCWTGGEGEARFNAALKMARMHFEQENDKDDEDINW